MNKLVEEIIKPILEANSDIKKVVGIFGGRFQPFGPHHRKYINGYLNNLMTLI